MRKTDALRFPKRPVALVASQNFISKYPVDVCLLGELIKWHLSSPCSSLPSRCPSLIRKKWVYYPVTNRGPSRALSLKRWRGFDDVGGEESVEYISSFL